MLRGHLPFPPTKSKLLHSKCVARFSLLGVPRLLSCSHFDGGTMQAQPKLEKSVRALLSAGRNLHVPAPNGLLVLS